MRNADEDMAVGNLTDHPQTPPAVYHDGQPKVNYWREVVKWLKQEDKDKKEKDDKWLENMRGMLSLISTMIATISFQLAINPPGGILPAKDNATFDELSSCRDDPKRPCAGESVSALIYAEDFHRFQKFNAACFVASLSVCLLLISGIPLNHKFPIWILSIGMIFILSCLAFTFLNGMLLVTPTDDSWETFRDIYKSTIKSWVALIGIVGLFLTIRFLVWFIRKCIEVFKPSK